MGTPTHLTDILLLLLEAISVVGTLVILPVVTNTNARARLHAERLMELQSGFARLNQHVLDRDDMTKETFARHEGEIQNLRARTHVLERHILPPGPRNEMP